MGVGAAGSRLRHKATPRQSAFDSTSFTAPASAGNRNRLAGAPTADGRSRYEGEIDGRRAEAMAELEVLCAALKRPMPVIERCTPLRDIRYEIKRLLIVDERARAIKQMRTGVIFAAAGCEMLNKQVGSPLELAGFARSTARAAATDRKFDETLHALYLKYWRRPVDYSGTGTAGGQEDGGGGGVGDLAFALAISAASFHLSKMDLGSIL